MAMGVPVRLGMGQRRETKVAALMGAILLATAEALAQEQQTAGVENALDDGQESKRRIIISIVDRKLALVEDGRVVKIYPTAVGAAATPSPTGTFKIVTRVTNPTWYGPHHQVVAPGKSNPLGTRWMGLSRRGYGIHGTNNQSSIGHSVSHGCIRMRKADVEELFKIAKVGDVVEMIASPTAEMAWIFGPAEETAAAE
jgi:lipoprotein-anchoring transpeptidase ErfK/SrfK